MDIKTFLEELEKTMVRRGLDPETAHAKAAKLEKTLSEEDIKEISSLDSGEKLKELVESVAPTKPREAKADGIDINVTEASTPRAKPPRPQIPATRTSPSPSGTQKQPRDPGDPSPSPKNQKPAAPQTKRPVQEQPDVSVRQAPKPEQTPEIQPQEQTAAPVPVQPQKPPVNTDDIQIPVQRPAVNNVDVQKQQRQPVRADGADSPQQNPQRANKADEYFRSPKAKEENEEGKKKFILTILALSPLILLVIALILAVFGAVFIALAAIIAALIIAMCAIIAAGVVISLIAIIYGVTQLFTFRAAGIYEIGLGILVGGVTAFAAIILYNIAIRFLPWVMKKVGRLFSFVFDKLRELYVNYRRECYDI